MNYQIVEVSKNEKSKLYKMLQFALYDGSFYIDNNINNNIEFEYKWFEEYFLNPKRKAYFIKNNEKYLGMVMVNENIKFIKEGKCIAEFFILPRYRRNHLGKKVAFDIFNKFKGWWEVQPMENNPIAYSFWKNTIAEYTKNKYSVKNGGVEDIFIFESK